VAVILRPMMLDAIILWLEIAVALGLVGMMIVLVAERWRR
jgi:hypothetical protein